MAAEATASMSGHAPTRPYPPSWLDRLFNAISRIPGPTWLAYLVLVVPMILLNSTSRWLSGLTPWGEIDPSQAFWALMTVAVVGANHHLRNVAGSSFDAFRPALGTGVTDPERARYELTTMPARAILLVTIFSIVITPAYYLADPKAAQIIGFNGAGFAVRVVSEGITSAVIVAILFQGIRQARRVNRLHAVATDVDPFRPAPLHAFSRLTAQTGLVLVAFNAVGVFANPTTITSEAMVGLYLPWLLTFVIGAIAVFTLPLLGMHRRLQTIKDTLEAAGGGRLRALLLELDQAVDARDSERVDALDRMVGALRREREVLAQLPTWPWSTTTLRGFGSALLLPIGLFLVQRYLGAALGG
ncbi:MAG: hypothetical protein ABI598_01985 [Chloroflexota bacterium]